MQNEKEVKPARRSNRRVKPGRGSKIPWDRLGKVRGDRADRRRESKEAMVRSEGYKIRCHKPTMETVQVEFRPRRGAPGVDETKENWKLKKKVGAVVDVLPTSKSKTQSGKIAKDVKARGN